jgi:RHS repeat-associated protein
MNAISEPEAEGYNNAQILPEDGNAMRNYTRTWEYDSVGNIMEMIHQANNGNWTRTYEYDNDSNKLVSTTVGQTTVNYAHNQHGSITAMPHLSAMEWDFAERLAHITRGNTEAYYNYDSNGERTRKVVEKGEGIVETRLYLGGFEIFRKTNANGLQLERETLHIMNDYGQNNTEETERETEEDNQNNNNIPKPKKETPNTWRIAIVDTKTWENNNPVQNITPVQRYQLSNNIESATLEVDENADIISYEEYYPYGDTSFRGKSSVSEVSEKRYRYAGKEKDDESGLYYFHARYYGSMVGIFISVDPKFEKYPDVSPFVYCMDNPVKYIDSRGMYVEVTANEDGTYIITGGKLDNNRNIYIMKDNKRTGILGQTFTPYSFFSDNGNIVKDAIINPKDKSGQEFIDNLKAEKPNLLEYIPNATTTSKKYNFKIRGGNNEQNHYRGVSIKDYHGNAVYASARDVGNYGAGYVAGREGLIWEVARFGFDGYQTWTDNKNNTSWTQFRLSFEGKTTRSAERKGYNAGQRQLLRDIINVPMKLQKELQNEFQMQLWIFHNKILDAYKVPR